MRPLTLSMIAVASIGLSVIVFAIVMMYRTRTDLAFKTRLSGLIFILAGALLIVSMIAEWLGIVHVFSIVVAFLGAVMIMPAVVALVIANLR